MLVKEGGGEGICLQTCLRISALSYWMINDEK